MALSNGSLAKRSFSLFLSKSIIFLRGDGDRYKANLSKKKKKKKTSIPFHHHLSTQKKKKLTAKFLRLLCSYIEMQSAMETPSSSLPNTIVSSAEPPWRRQFVLAHQKWCKNDKFSASKRYVSWHSLEIAN